MRVLFSAAPNFIFLDHEIRLEMTIPPTSIYALSAVLAKRGYKTDLLDPVDFFRNYRKENQFEELLRGYDVLCISSNTITWPMALWMIRRAAAAQACKVILGGVHASYCDTHVMTIAPVDVIVRGEGETALPEVFAAFESGSPLSDISGITYREGGEIRRNPDRPPMTREELDRQPLPLWSKVPGGAYCFMPVELSRGCHYACNFCSIYHKRNRRAYSWRTVRRRIEQGLRVLPKFTYRTLMFSDDCFTSDPAMVERVADFLVAAAPDVEVGIEARANEVIRDQVLRGLSKMRIGFLQIGVECGYAEGLKNVGKGITIGQVIESAKRLRAAGITGVVKYSYIVGLPWETASDMKRTIAFAMQLAAEHGNMVQINWYMLSPGNEVFKDLLAKKLVSLYDFDSWNEYDMTLFFRSHPTLDMDTYKEIREFAARLEHTYPWVSVLGNVFKTTEHPHLPVDITLPGAKAPFWVGRAPFMSPHGELALCGHKC